MQRFPGVLYGIGNAFFFAHFAWFPLCTLRETILCTNYYDEPFIFLCKTNCNDLTLRKLHTKFFVSGQGRALALGRMK